MLDMNIVFHFENGVAHTVDMHDLIGMDTDEIAEYIGKYIPHGMCGSWELELDHDCGELEIREDSERSLHNIRFNGSVSADNDWLCDSLRFLADVLETAELPSISDAVMYAEMCIDFGRVLTVSEFDDKDCMLESYFRENYMPEILDEQLACLPSDLRGYFDEEKYADDLLMSDYCEFSGICTGNSYIYR